jgi:hypothetical protein
MRLGGDAAVEHLLGGPHGCPKSISRRTSWCRRIFSGSRRSASMTVAFSLPARMASLLPDAGLDGGERPAYVLVSEKVVAAA